MNALKDFFKLESASGILLMIAAALALIVANSPLAALYDSFLNIPVAVQVGKLEIAKPLLLWINDGFMAIFFFLVGLELKREIRSGQLSKPDNIMLPAIGALGGMVVPAAIYVFFTIGDDHALSGWAIPAATDIAFALGVLALLGSRIPTSLKIFLVSLAIIDDIGAILIIALFYTNNISTGPLIVAGLSLFVLWWMNKRNVTEIASYVLIGVVLWVAMLKSGVHATLAGVLLAFFIPMYDKKKAGYLPVQELEHSLHPAVAYVILPLFAFANAGINFSDMGMESIAHPVTLGVLLGLFVGKQVGVFGFCYVAIKLKLTKLPSDISMIQLYGTALLCGVGFTMSLFIGSLAFEETGMKLAFDERVGILGGSLLSAVAGYLVLRMCCKDKNAA
ncbi:Na+/H+ antiporter NhaA [Bowmanella yangjiangensis]|uniref:Na(+)/H(+) antiporter NhaA n=1 Tax=Bowmanella yangjiangensis TaxID=2811230 RepID=A0ABS3CZX5_9ALTE|nr:Na+/H+ antiporter NhaA [Bowmanella yangjiangensis]MBN7821905.1 Na+/H+ antiporter NhaA [Bowmanella yangjiangensis]